MREDINTLCEQDGRIDKIAQDPQFMYWMSVLTATELDPDTARDLSADMWELVAREYNAEPSLREPVFRRARTIIRYERLERGEE